MSESVGAALSVVMGDNHRIHLEPAGDEGLTQAQHIHVVGYAKVVAHLVFLYVECADHNHDFGLVGKLAEHPEFAVRLESGEHAARVIVVE